LANLEAGDDGTVNVSIVDEKVKLSGFFGIIGKTIAIYEEAFAVMEREAVV